MYAVGLMSGTSLDGVDAALCQVEGSGRNTKIELLSFETTPIPEDVKAEIRLVMGNTFPQIDVLTSLNFKLGKVFAQAVNRLLTKNHMTGKDLAFVASHGQTLYHIPKPTGTLVRSTLQMGESAVIAYEVGAPVISNFRVMDVAAGGEGAPLVPLSEIILYGEAGKNIALQNLGGIGNVTLLPGTLNEAEVFAFDTGPGNMVIDEAMRILYGKSYDENGQVALSGKIAEPLLSELLQHPYLDLPLPKSTGREDFGEAFTRDLLARYAHVAPEDFIATVTQFTASTMADAYHRYILPQYPLDRVVLGGGGAHNEAILSGLRQLLPQVEVLTQEDLGLSSDAKEAIAFVILGNETWHGSFGNVPGATGASERVILGQITPCPTAFGRKVYGAWPEPGK